MLRALNAYQSCCLLLLVIKVTNCQVQSGDASSTPIHKNETAIEVIKIPAIPHEHLLCWLRNLPTATRDRLNECCSNTNHNNNNCTAIAADDWRVHAKDEPEVDAKQRLCRLIKLEWTWHNSVRCWGYEADASERCLLYRPECRQSAPTAWAANKFEQLKNFFSTADFGYVRERRREIEHYCKPTASDTEFTSNTSELKCAKLLRYCTGKNVFINLRRMPRVQESIRYREDVLGVGDIGGWNCTLDRDKLLNESDHKSPLMSWAAEMVNFQVQSNDDDTKTKCDVTIEKPTFILKLDATINMYHHFCDFINLYISMHVNGSHFDLDNNILIWDNYPYRSNFALTWKAFTRNPLLSLADFSGKRVCFKNVMFPLLPRMIFGLYYNMPLIPGCEQSGLFRAFNRHLLFHMEQQNSTSEAMRLEQTIRVTFIGRNTRYRRVLNQEQLISAAREHFKGAQVHIEVVDFNHQMAFREQVAISARSDILIGMHGAGLTHTLFQPDYGVLFELYNCQDPDCYKDLARLRGTHYLTWRDESKLLPVESDESQAADRNRVGAAHAKFVNYRFDVHEFVHIVAEAVELVRARKRTFLERHNSQWWWHQLESPESQDEGLKKNMNHMEL